MNWNKAIRQLHRWLSHHLHGDCHCQFRHHGGGRSACLCGLLAATTTLSAIVQRPLHVCLALLCRSPGTGVGRKVRNRSYP